MEIPFWIKNRKSPTYADLIKNRDLVRVVDEYIWVQQDIDNPYWEYLPGLGIHIGNWQTRYWFPKDHPRFDELAELFRQASPGRKKVRLSLLYGESVPAMAILDIQTLKPN